MTTRKVQPISASPDRSILIVDDDAAAVDSLAQILTDEGYQVSSANNGKEALVYLRGAPPPRVIILDLFMPEMDG